MIVWDLPDLLGYQNPATVKSKILTSTSYFQVGLRITRFIHYLVSQIFKQACNTHLTEWFSVNKFQHHLMNKLWYYLCALIQHLYQNMPHTQYTVQGVLNTSASDRVCQYCSTSKFANISLLSWHNIIQT